jgi:hypothetical protein
MLKNSNTVLRYSAWGHAVSMVTIAPLIASVCSSSGISVISLDFSLVACCLSATSTAAAKAADQVQRPTFVAAVATAGLAVHGYHRVRLQRRNPSRHPVPKARLHGPCIQQA